jgi:hypothetical protein
MMIKRAEKLGVPWRETVKQWQQRDWSQELQAVENPESRLSRILRLFFPRLRKGQFRLVASF